MAVGIRPWRPEDAPVIAEALGDPGVRDNLRDGLPWPYTEADALEFIAASQAEGMYSFAITEDDIAVGSIKLSRQGNIHSRTAELGYYVVRRRWGRSIGTEALRLMCKFAFEQTDLLRIFAEPFVENIASRRAIEKNGFTLEGIMRKNAVKNGVVRDMCMYALVKEDER